MNQEYYAIFSMDSERHICFIEKAQNDDIRKKLTYDEMVKYAESLGYETVDISLWVNNGYVDKCNQVRDYVNTSKKR